MKKCYSCGKLYNSASLICSKCGRKVCSVKCIKQHQRKGCIIKIEY